MVVIEKPTRDRKQRTCRPKRGGQKGDKGTGRFGKKEEKKEYGRPVAGFSACRFRRNAGMPAKEAQKRGLHYADQGKRGLRGKNRRRGGDGVGRKGKGRRQQPLIKGKRTFLSPAIVKNSSINSRARAVARKEKTYALG